MTIEIKLRKGEPMDRAIRRMKKRLDREGVIRDVRAKRYFEKPSDKKRKARKVAAFTQMLRTSLRKNVTPIIPLIKGNFSRQLFVETLRY